MDNCVIFNENAPFCLTFFLFLFGYVLPLLPFAFTPFFVLLLDLCFGLFSGNALGFVFCYGISESAKLFTQCKIFTVGICH